MTTRVREIQIINAAARIASFLGVKLAVHTENGRWFLAHYYKGETSGAIHRISPTLTKREMLDYLYAFEQGMYFYRDILEEKGEINV